MTDKFLNEKDYLELWELLPGPAKGESLEDLFTTIADQWNFERNKSLKPCNVHPFSTLSVWWRCSLGHEWKSTIQNRTRGGNNCPYCGHQKILPAFSLKAIHPEIAKDWNYQKNGGITPDQVAPKTNKTYWWKCPRGHEWVAAVSNRVSGTGCPHCSNRKITAENSLATLNPSLAAEWDYEKNYPLTPDDVGAGSYKAVWWVCKGGHTWSQKVWVRNRGNACPYCANQKVDDTNSLMHQSTTLVQEWNYERNAPLTPSDVVPGSGKTVWWKCPKGHEWQAVINRRYKGAGCPYCSGFYVTTETSLEKKNPRLAAQWNYKKNSPLTPRDVSASSKKRVWWTCKFGHEWQAIIGSRNRSKGYRSICPLCQTKT